MSDQRRGSGSRSSSSRSPSSGSSSSRSSTRPSSSGSRCFGTPTPAPCLTAARDPSPDEASDQAMRLLKRMKPSQLREISKAAMALERTKLENSKKVKDFIAKNENFVDLVGECYICLEPLLNNIGTTKFGVVSWKCRCKVPQKAHAACLFSKISRAPHGRATCDMCSSPIKFERTLKGNNEATIRFQIDGDKEEDIVEDGESSDESGSSSDEDKEEDIVEDAKSSSDSSDDSDSSSEDD